MTAPPPRRSRPARAASAQALPRHARVRHRPAPQHDRRATQRLGGGQLRGIGPGRCLPDARGHRQRLLLRRLRVPCGLTESIVSASDARPRSRMRRPSVMRVVVAGTSARRLGGCAGDVAQESVRRGMSALTCHRLDPPRSTRHVLQHVLWQDGRSGPQRGPHSVHRSSLPHHDDPAGLKTRRHELDSRRAIELERRRDASLRNDTSTWGRGDAAATATIACRAGSSAAPGGRINISVRCWSSSSSRPRSRR